MELGRHKWESKGTKCTKWSVARGGAYTYGSAHANAADDARQSAKRQEAMVLTQHDMVFP